MREDQFNKLTDYIEAVVQNSLSGPEGLFESVAMNKKRKELYDSFFSNKEEEDPLYLKELQISDQKEIIREHTLFFSRLLDPDDLGWAVTEEVRNEARVFLGIPKVKIKR